MRCCHHGAYLQEDSEYPKLNVLPEALKWLCLMRGEHFGKLSAKYNKILSIGSTGGREPQRWRVRTDWRRSCCKDEWANVSLFIEFVKKNEWDKLFHI
jgi:hypothetical protein